MEEKKMEFKEWVKTHKKQLVLAGVSITTIFAIILGIKNRKTLIEVWQILKNTVDDSNPELNTVLHEEQIAQSVGEVIQESKTYTFPTDSFEVRQHIRKLSEGRHHSPEKAIEAAAMGIDLPLNQTIVDAYPKYVAA